MQQIELNEPIVAALVERLTTGLPAVIAAINGEIDDEATLAESIAVLDYIPPPSDLLEPPVIGIGDGRGGFEDDTGFSATGKFELLITVYEQADDQQLLVRRLRRWAKAIARVALDGRNLGEAAWGSRLVGTRPGPTLVDNPDQPREWLSWTGLLIEFKRDEE